MELRRLRDVHVSWITNCGGSPHDIEKINQAIARVETNVAKDPWIYLWFCMYEMWLAYDHR